MIAEHLGSISIITANNCRLDGLDSAQKRFYGQLHRKSLHPAQIERVCDSVPAFRRS
jgi:hypothetical protein